MHMEQVYKKNEAKKINSSSGIYRNVSYLLLFGKRQWQILEVSFEQLFLLLNKHLL